MLVLGLTMMVPFLFAIFLSDAETSGKHKVILLILVIYMGLGLLIFIVINCRIHKFVLWWN